MSKDYELLKGDTLGKNPQKPTVVTVICRPHTHQGKRYGDVKEGADVQIPAVVEVSPKTYQSMQKFRALWTAEEDEKNEKHIGVAEAEKRQKATARAAEAPE